MVTGGFVGGLLVCAANTCSSMLLSVVTSRTGEAGANDRMTQLVSGVMLSSRANPSFTGKSLGSAGVGTGVKRYLAFRKFQVSFDTMSTNKTGSSSFV